MNPIKYTVEIGERYTHLTVIGEPKYKLKKGGGRERVVPCQCDCGQKKEVRIDSLKKGLSKSCSPWCQARQKAYYGETVVDAKNWQVKIGEIFGDLEVIEAPKLKTFTVNIDGEKKLRRLQYVKCRCTYESCGNESYYICNKLIRGASIDCGCIRKKKRRKLARGTQAQNGKKRCSKCMEYKDVTEFSKSGHKEDGLQHQCWKCHKNAYLLRTYNLTIEDYYRILEEQGGICACCGSDKSCSPTKGDFPGDFFHVDHDHNTGGIRGLLCFKCNAGIGHLGDNIKSIEKALAYLKRYYERNDDDSGTTENKCANSRFGSHQQDENCGIIQDLEAANC